MRNIHIDRNVTFSVNVYLEEIGGALAGNQVDDYRDTVEKWLTFPSDITLQKGAPPRIFDIIINPGNQTIPECFNAEVIIQGATYDPAKTTLNLYVKNRGTMSLTFDTLFKYQNGTISQSGQIYTVASGQLITFTFASISSTLEEATIHARECADVKDTIQRQWITGL